MGKDFWSLRWRNDWILPKYEAPQGAPDELVHAWIRTDKRSIGEDKLGVLTKEEFEEALKQNGFEESSLDAVRQSFLGSLGPNLGQGSFAIRGVKKEDGTVRGSPRMIIWFEAFKVLIILKRNSFPQMAMAQKSLLEPNSSVDFLNHNLWSYYLFRITYPE